jgi:hypothetical protein
MFDDASSHWKFRVGPKFNSSTEVLFLEYIKATCVSPVKVLNFNFVSHFDYLILYEHTIILNVCNNVRAFP